MYFLGFPVYRLDQTMNSVSSYCKRIVFNLILSIYFHLKIWLWNYFYLQIAAAKDPDTSFFRKLDAFQPCELTELKAGTHVFAVYGKCLHLCPVVQCCLLCLYAVIMLHRS